MTGNKNKPVKKCQHPNLFLKTSIENPTIRRPAEYSELKAMANKPPERYPHFKFEESKSFWYDHRPRQVNPKQNAWEPKKVV